MNPFVERPSEKSRGGKRRRKGRGVESVNYLMTPASEKEILIAVRLISIFVPTMQSPTRVHCVTCTLYIIHRPMITASGVAPFNAHP